MEKNISSFELKLVIIAVLIPAFLETFPPLINSILYPSLIFRLPLIITYILGLFWFLVLLIGLLRLNVFLENQRIFSDLFDFLFLITSVFTLLIIMFIITQYLIYFVSQAIGKNVTIIIFISLAIYTFYRALKSAWRF